MKRSDAVVVLSIALLLVALGHTHEDATFAGEPPLAELLVGSALVGAIVLIHLVGLIFARTGQRLGFGLSMLAGAAWALLFTFAHIGDALSLDWRYGIFSSVLVLGGIALGVALVLVAGWSLVRPARL